jgi:DNA-directed RNA polymerase beta subunit
MVTEVPFVGTGMEGKVARDSGVVMIAKNSWNCHQG